MKFKDVYIKEMPHIEFAGKYFDLELEKYEDIKDFFKDLNQILSGEEKRDKYGSVIKLSDEQEKEQFVELLKKDNFFMALLKKYKILSIFNTIIKNRKNL